MPTPALAAIRRARAAMISSFSLPAGMSISHNSATGNCSWRKSRPLDQFRGIAGTSSNDCNFKHFPSPSLKFVTIISNG